jgi:threonine/homoserine/homoserine lactone efflux protein
MIEASWLLFGIASLALIATPGQDMILVMSRSPLAQGPAAGPTRCQDGYCGKVVEAAPPRR